LLDKVDIRRIPVAAGAEVSYLDFVAQLQLNDWLDFEMCGLTTQQATQIKKSFQEGEFSEALLEAMLHNKEKVRNTNLIMNASKAISRRSIQLRNVRMLCGRCWKNGITGIANEGTSWEANLWSWSKWVNKMEDGYGFDIE